MTTIETRPAPQTTRPEHQSARRWVALGVALVALVAAIAGGFWWANDADTPTEAEALQELVAAEEAALDPYFGQSDPTAYVALWADDVTYYDPWSGGILAGQEARDYLMGFSGTIPPFDYEILNEKVVLDGDIATFTFNALVTDPASGAVVTDWNVTEINRFVDNDWEVIHVHFAIAGGEVPAPAAPVAPLSNDVSALLQRYSAAWNEIDREAFLGAITDDYELHTGQFGILDGPTMARRLGEWSGFHTETIGESHMVGTGPWYVAEVGLVTGDSVPEGGVQSLNIYKIVDVDGVLKIERQFTYGNQFG